MSEARPKHCGGCGETDPAKRCIGCLADFGPGLISEGEAADMDPKRWREHIGFIDGPIFTEVPAPQQAAEDLPRDDTGRVTSDYEPTAQEIEVCRNAICREFGNNGTDGYYIRILKAINAVRPTPQYDDAQAHIAALTAKVEELTLNAEELDTILTIGKNEQSGRVTNYELQELVRVYRENLSALEGEEHE